MTYLGFSCNFHKDLCIVLCIGQSTQQRLMHGLSPRDSTNYGQYIPHNLDLYNGIECPLLQVLVGKIHRKICRPAVTAQACSYHHEHESSTSYGHSISLACDAFSCTLSSYNGIEDLFVSAILHLTYAHRPIEHQYICTWPNVS